MKIRLSENFRAVFYAPYYATQALGLYAREGVEVEFINSSVPGDAVAGLLDGTIDLTWGGPMRVMRAHDQRPDSPLVCFGEVVARDPFFLIARRGEQADFRLADLARLRLATVSEVPTPWMCLQEDMRRAGLDPAKLDRVTDQSMASNAGALRRGEVDVVQLFQPLVEELIESGAGHIWHAAAERGPTSYTTLYARRALLATRRTHFELPGMATLDLRTLPKDQAEALLLSICPRLDPSANAGQAQNRAQPCERMRAPSRLA